MTTNLRVGNTFPDFELRMIASDVSDDDVFFHFTAIPGEGYRTLRPDTPVRFAVVKSRAGLTARNIQKEE